MPLWGGMGRRKGKPLIDAGAAVVAGSQNTKRMRSAKIKKKSSSEAKRVMFDNSKHSDSDCCLRGLSGRSLRNKGFR